MSDSYRSAVISMPSSGQLGGEQPLPFVRFPFFPTAPWYSTNPNVGYQVRFYSTTLNPTDGDYAVNSEAIRTVQFDIPVRLIAINGAAVQYTSQGLIDTASVWLNEQVMNLGYLFRVEYTTGDKLHTAARLASTVVGTSRNPGELGGHGYNIDQGATLTVGITPLDVRLKVDITFVCLEMRAPRNFAMR
jgi:hypothetical protein